MIKKVFSAVLAIALCVSTFCMPTFADEMKYLKSSIDFKKADALDTTTEFKVSGDMKIIDGVLQNPGTSGVYRLEWTGKYYEKGTVKVDFDIQSESPENGQWMTSFFGLRLASSSIDPTNSSGLWISFRNSSIGIRTKAWPETSEIEVGYDFSMLRHVFIEDNQDKNIVSIYVNDDSGKKGLAASIVIDGSTLKMYNGAPAGDPAIDSNLLYDVEKGGSIGWWVHNIPNTALGKITIEYPQVIKVPYVAADPTKIRDGYMDTWVATDDLGRETPSYDEVGAPQQGKMTGMFYFLAQGGTNAALYDHFKAYNDAGGGEAGVKAVWEALQSGGIGSNHYWGEPYFGYYRSDDEWVIRKHATMLVNAGVDFIFFDCSNNILYPEVTSKLLATYKKMREEGAQTPKFMYFLGDNTPTADNCIPQIYNEIYKDGNYKDMWVMYDGKPLLLANVATFKNKEVLDTFTVRRSWAFESSDAYKRTQGKGTWLWADLYPQAPGLSPEGDLEQMIVMSGYWAGENGGRSNTSKNPTSSTYKIKADVPRVDDFEFSLIDNGTTGKGLLYQEHWDRALDVNPPVIMITGWNEWTAGRWDPANGGSGQTIANTYIADRDDPARKHMYVDLFNPEFSRDIEPMMGGFKDNYYYQTVNNIRRYKGVRQTPVNNDKITIDLAKGFEQWDSVKQNYYDTPSDISKRNKVASAGPETYINETGRNDIDLAKIAYGDDSSYFYVKTANAITSPEGENWMNLFINTDNDFSTGWYGYDILINRSRTASTVSIEKNIGNSWKWEKAGDASFVIQNNQLMIKVPNSITGLSGKAVFDFKWADNSTTTGDIMQFLDLGDSAPDARFNFRVIRNTLDISDNTFSTMAVNTIAMAIGKNTAFKGYKKVAVDSKNTETAPFISDGRTFVPIRFISETLDATVSWDDISKVVTIIKGESAIRFTIDKAEIEINGEKKSIDASARIVGGRTYVPLRAAAEALNRQVLWNAKGLIQLGGKGIKAADDAAAQELISKL